MRQLQRIARSILVSVVLLPLLVFAPGLGPHSGVAGAVEPVATRHRSISDLGMESARQIVVSEAHNRIVVAGDDEVRLYRLDNLDHVVTVDRVLKANHLRLWKDSVFVVGTEKGVISEIDLKTGERTDHWSANKPAVTSFDVSDDYFWIAYNWEYSTSRIARMHRPTKVVDTYRTELRYWPNRAVRIDHTRPGEVVVSGSDEYQRMMRFRVDGDELLTVASVDLTGLWRKSARFDLSVDGTSVFGAQRDGLFELASETLTRKPITAGTPVDAFLMGLEPVTNDHIIVAGNYDVWLFDRDVPQFHNHFGFEGLVRSVAVTAEEAFVVSKPDAAGARLDVYGHDYGLSPDDDADAGRVSFSRPGGYRGVRELGLVTIRDMVVAEEADRLVIAGDDQVDFYSASTVEFLFSVEKIYGAGSMEFEGDSLFVAGRHDGIIYELDLKDGSTLNEWKTTNPRLFDIDLSENFLWFTHDQGVDGGDVSRFDRASGQIHALRDVDQAGSEQWIVVDRLDEDLFYLATYQGPVKKLRWTEPSSGVLALLSSTGYAYDFEMALGGAAIWKPGHGLNRISTSDLTLTPRAYTSELKTDFIAVEPTENRYLAVGGRLTQKQVVQVFDRGTSTIRNQFYTGASLSQLAVSTERVFAISGYDTPGLDAWPINYVERNSELTVWVEANGQPPTEEVEITVSCVGVTEVPDPNFFRIEVSAMVRYGTSHTFSVPANHRNCDLFREVQGQVSTTIRFWTGSQWTSSGELDPVMRGLAAVLIVFPSPATDLELFVKQTFVDVLGREASEDEWFDAGSAIYYEETSLEGFVVGLMDGEAKFEDRQARIARLYRAFFLRDSDGPGFEYWVGEASRGKTLFSISEFFSISPEFELRYGSLDDREFIRLVYDNVLGRSPDDEGYAFWQQQMQGGMTRGELMTYFSDAPEYRSYTSDRVFVVYAVRTLDRQDPSEAKIEYLLTQLRAGGKERVVSVLIYGDDYFDRFWVSAEDNNAGLQLDDVVETCELCDQVQRPEMLEESSSQLSRSN